MMDRDQMCGKNLISSLSLVDTRRRHGFLGQQKHLFSYSKVLKLISLADVPMYQGKIYNLGNKDHP